MGSRVFDVIKERCSVRSYSDRPIEAEKLEMILESARLASSATNAQPWHFYILKSKEKQKELERMPLNAQVIMNSFIAKAPVVIVATAGPIDLLHKVMSYVVNKRWYYLDVAIALEHMVLTAWDLGIGSCWVGFFNEKKTKEIVGIPRNEEVIAMVTLGYPEDGFTVKPKNRKPAQEVFKTVD